MADPHIAQARGWFGDEDMTRHDHDRRSNSGRGAGAGTTPAAVSYLAVLEDGFPSCEAFLIGSGDSRTVPTIRIVRVDPHELSGHTSLDGPRRRRRRRGRQGKPLSDMSFAELKRAMWLLPLWMAVASLAAEARVAVAAIEEAIPLWLAVVLAVGCLAPTVVVVIRGRRRYRARLQELGTTMGSSFAFAEPLAPLPLRLRLWLIGVPLLAAAVVVLVAVLPGDGDTCVTKGIATAAAHEGICQRGANLFGGGVTYNVVDAGHVLHMPGYDARLLATTMRPVPITNPATDRAFYPNGIGTLVCLEVAITNRGSLPMTFDAGGEDIDLLLQSPKSAGASDAFSDQPDLRGEPSPSLATMSPVQPGQTSVGWVAYIAPAWALQTLNARATDLDFLLPSNGDAGPFSASYVGQIRLWKAGNAIGARALGEPPALR